MLRKLALLLVPLIVVGATACGGDDSDGGGADPTDTPEATATEAATRAPTDIPTTPTPLVIATPDLGGASDVLSAVNPLELLNGLTSGIGNPSFGGDVDPALKNELLAASDLPSGFTSMGDFTFAAPSQYGDMQLAANIFTSGDMTSSDDFGTMVMSASIIIPPGAMDEFGAGALDELRNLSDADLASAMGAAEDFGVTFTDLRVLDGSGLGDGGTGIHMVMDFGGLMDAFGAPDGGTNPIAGGMAFDMYMFVEGDHMHMAVVMYAGDSSPAVDARHLADVLDSRVGGSSA